MNNNLYPESFSDEIKSNNSQNALSFLMPLLSGNLNPTELLNNLSASNSNLGQLMPKISQMMGLLPQQSKKQNKKGTFKKGDFVKVEDYYKN